MEFDEHAYKSRVANLLNKHPRLENAGIKGVYYDYPGVIILELEPGDTYATWGTANTTWGWDLTEGANQERYLTSGNSAIMSPWACRTDDGVYEFDIPQPQAVVEVILGTNYNRHYGAGFAIAAEPFYHEV